MLHHQENSLFLRDAVSPCQLRGYGDSVTCFAVNVPILFGLFQSMPYEVFGLVFLHAVLFDQTIYGVAGANSNCFSFGHLNHLLGAVLVLDLVRRAGFEHSIFSVPNGGLYMLN